MKTVVPDYYDKFSCIADKCKHNCCIGWEIDIDEETYQLYRNTEGILKNRLKNNIIQNDDCRCFKLTSEGRCSFLDKNNLCEIITVYGEEYLCQICDAHPRFKNYFTDRVEIGLGLCCEASGKLILSNENKTYFKSDNNSYDNDAETVFFNLRENIFRIVRNRDLSIQSRVQQLCSKFGIDVDIEKKKLVNFLYSLEHLDDNWENYIKVYSDSTLNVIDLLSDKRWQIVYEQLLMYFLYRHLAESLYDNCFLERIRFCIISCNIIFRLCEIKFKAEKKLEIEDCVEIARMYSCEIEYSEDNTEAFIEFLR